APAMGAEPWSASFGTRIWLPSVSGAARLSDVSNAPGRGPPAASIASITRAPSSNSYTPGCRTQPATSTSRITAGDGLAVAAGAGVRGRARDGLGERSSVPEAGAPERDRQQRDEADELGARERRQAFAERSLGHGLPSISEGRPRDASRERRSGP